MVPKGFLDGFYFLPVAFGWLLSLLGAFLGLPCGCCYFPTTIYLTYRKLLCFVCQNPYQFPTMFFQNRRRSWSIFGAPAAETQRRKSLRYKNAQNLLGPR